MKTITALAVTPRRLARASPQVGVPRFSFPFFARARMAAEVAPGLRVADFVEGTVLFDRPWVRRRADMPYLREY